MIASEGLDHATKIQNALNTDKFHCYATHDIIGVQLGGALKNPLAIGAGIIEGLGL